MGVVGLFCLFVSLGWAAVDLNVGEVGVWDASCVGCELPDLGDYYVTSVDGRLELTLVVDVVRVVLPYTSFETRVYNGSIKGPRWVVRTGDVISLTLVNNLLDVDNGGTMNLPRKLNTTNMHTHGLHISGPGMPPGDYVLWGMEPQSSLTYEYVLPEDHYPGHYWYHPHHHGATYVQASGGMYGSIELEVQDPHFELPPQIASLETRYIEILNMPLDDPGFGLDMIQLGFGNGALLQPKATKTVGLTASQTRRPRRTCCSMAPTSRRSP